MNISTFVPRSEAITLSAAFIPDVLKRRDYLVLWCFLDTLRDVGAKVTDPLLGEIRLKWWQEAISSPVTVIDRDPLLIEIKRIISDYGLNLEHMAALVEAQSFWLGGSPSSETAIIEHIDQSEGQLASFGAQIIGQLPPISFFSAMRALGLNYFKSKNIEMKFDDRIYKMQASKIAKESPYQLLPLIIPSLINHTDHGIFLRFKLLKIFMFGV